MLESWRIGNDILVNCMIKSMHLKEDERVLFLERDISKIHFKGSFLGGGGVGKWERGVGA